MPFPAPGSDGEPGSGMRWCEGLRGRGSHHRAPTAGADGRQTPRRTTHAGHPRDHHPTILERLAEGLDGIAPELGEFVHEQDAVVPEDSGMFPEAYGRCRPRMCP